MNVWLHCQHVVGRFVCNIIIPKYTAYHIAVVFKKRQQQVFCVNKVAMQ